MSNKHETVLLNEAVLALNVKHNGNYVDATFGRGGHSKNILKHLEIAETGQLLVIDRDPAAIKEAHKLAKTNNKIIVEHGAFEMLEQMINQNFANKVDGILFDLGIFLFVEF